MGRGFRLTEIPIVFTDRARGTSKMNRSIISEAIFGIILMKIKVGMPNKQTLLIRQAKVVNEGQIKTLDILVEGCLSQRSLPISSQVQTSKSVEEDTPTRAD